MRSVESMLNEIYGPLPQRLARRRQVVLPQQEDPDSLLNSVAGGSLSALQFIGQSLDKPGRSIRGLLDGKPEELLNLIPFSSTIGLTDRDGWFGDSIALTNDDNYTSGRDLLRDAGIIGHRDTWGNFAAGLGVELVTDPLSYLTLGTGSALTQAGKAAAKAGVLPSTAMGRMSGSLRGLLDDAAKVGTSQVDDLTRRLEVATGGSLADDLLDQPLSGLAGIGLPFANPSKIMAPGERSLAIGKAIDSSYDTLKYGDPGFYLGGTFRKVRELLDSSLRGAGHAATHRALDVVPQTGRNVADTISGRKATNDLSYLGDMRKLESAGIDVTNKDVARNMMAAREATWPGAPATLAERQQVAADSGKSVTDLAVDHVFRNSGLTDEQIEAIKPVISRHHEDFAKSLAEQQEIGFGAKALQDETIAYSPRSMLSEQLSQRPDGQHMTMPTSNRNMHSRSEAAKNLPPTETKPGGTASLIEAMNDPVLGKHLQRSVKSDLLNLPSESTATRFLEVAGENGIPNAEELLGNATQWQTVDMLKQMQRGEAPTLLRRPPKNPADRAAQRAVTHFYENYLARTPEQGAEDLARYNALRRQKAQLEGTGQKLPEAEEEFFNAIDAQLKQARLQAGWIRNLPADARYDHRVLDVARDAMSRSIQQAEMGKAVHRALVHGGDFLTQTSKLDGTPLPVKGEMRTQLPVGSEKVSAMKVLADAGMSDRTQAVRHFAETLDQLQPGRLADEFGEEWRDRLMNDGDSAEILSWLDKWVVDKSLADDIKNVMDFTSNPRSISPLLQTFDRLTAMLKSSLTSPFPAFASRNLQSLFWMDGVAGGFKNLAGMIKWWWNTIKLLKGDVIEGASQLPHFQGMGLDDVTATARLKELFAANQVSPIGFGDAMDQAGVTPGVANDLSRSRLKAELPTTFEGQGPFKAVGGNAAMPFKTLLWDPIKTMRNKGFDSGRKELVKAGKELIDIRKVRGGWQEGGDFSRNPIFGAGERINTYFEQLGRGATFLRKMAEGYAPDIAAAESRAAHVDFSALTPFERAVAKRVIPFYTFSRHAMPYQLKQMLVRPGGEVATLVKQSGRSASEDGFVPGQAIGAMELGRDPQTGMTRFVNVDLPHAVLDNLLAVGVSPLDTIQQSSMSLLSQTHPALKVPLETVAGKSFFQKGRPLTEQQYPTGNVLLDQVLTNSPASRVISTGKQLANLRMSPVEKLLNLGLGIRVSNVDVERARDRDARENAMKLLQESGARTFTTAYLPDEDPTQKQADLLNLMNELRIRRSQQRP